MKLFFSNPALAATITSSVVLFGSFANADSYKRISQTLDAGDYEQIRMEFAVGELEIEVWDQDTVEVEIELRAENSWAFWRSNDIDDVELAIDDNGDELSLRIRERNLNQEWVLKLPAKLAQVIELGVGEISIEELENSLSIELGVGEIDVELASDNYEDINVSVGVGDAVIRGFGDSRDRESNFVGAESYFRGNGEYQIEIELGVGDASVSF